MQKLPVDKVIPEEYRCKGWFCKMFSHWLNPFGNWNEPMPYPEIRKVQAEKSWLPAGVWWNLRNPFHNFCHYWIGITPLGNRYEWIIPESAGWIRSTEDYKDNWSYSYWKKEGSRFKLPFWNYTGTSWQFYIGWLSRGNFGIALRKTEK